MTAHDLITAATARLAPRLDFGLQIDGAAHADVVEMRVEEAPRRAPAVRAQHLEEIEVGVEPAGRR